eukprot:NODE_23695_length_655_cov_2.619318.p2 GENE.NODE_23695_length_655_cov_2.619318~~NODE_23695_length_655_cov_2.619318.p2  ORF type:complete len:57 (-),score=2.49 NODE_23695_length_655_cov_2.619318:404-574(-)
MGCFRFPKPVLGGSSCAGIMRLPRAPSVKYGCCGHHMWFSPSRAAMCHFKPTLIGT